MTSEAQVLRFDRSCTIVEAESLRAMLRDHLANHPAKTVHLDLSAVEEADVTLVQNLIAARKSAEAQGASVTAALSPAVAELLVRTGLAGWPAVAAA
ncbi:hypothetical protein GCM10011390_51070 [Aureimonas endophytica]|uniref:STAS domain-containing protein n=1 Tax=Aureimonas endophytica TaxID=2027858 RepID=A0A917A437_9HYPH|nr:STAS domain-containing protein [Aureimonas endophytica]GGE25419.1 hypothetical protein GCM10011390_51070 [Aureimonas endophytica]